MSFRDIALPLIERGLSVVPLKPRSKIAFMDNWPDAASSDPEQIQKWNQQWPDANCACVAKPDGIWILELDSPEAWTRIEAETGKKIPLTYRVRSRPGRGHIYFKSTPEAVAVGNLAQSYVKHGDWSARIFNQYVVSANSIHPLSGLPYEVVSDAPIIEAPSWLLNWMAGQKVAKKNSGITDGGPIPDGQRNSSLASIAGKLRHVGLSAEEIETSLLRINGERCKPPLPNEDVKTIAGSIGRYAVGQDTTVLIGGIPAGTQVRPQVQSQVQVYDLEDIPKFEKTPYPRFPEWVMKGTSIYNGLVAPYCEKNSRYPEYMFMPAMALLLNYIGTRVRIAEKNWSASLYMVLIGRRGIVHKSASVQDAIKYFEYCGLATHAGPNVKNAEGKILIFQVGSTEGLGIEMARTNCKNAVLFYDELSTLTNKAGIDGSSMISHLLSIYESGKFSNGIKARKETFALDPGTYCGSLIACTTDKNFNSHWSKMSGESSGLDDRFFFLYQPETFKEETVMLDVQTQAGSVETRRLIDKAVAQGVYEIVNVTPLQKRIKDIGNRGEIRAEKFALAFAIDSGLDEIDEVCVEKALALVQYEREVKEFLKPSEAFTKEGSLQMEIDRHLRKFDGSIEVRDLERTLHATRYGTTMWNQCYGGMVKSGWIMQIGSGKKGDPKRVMVMRPPENYDD